VESKNTLVDHQGNYVRRLVRVGWRGLPSVCVARSRGGRGKSCRRIGSRLEIVKRDHWRGLSLSRRKRGHGRRAVHLLVHARLGQSECLRISLVLNFVLRCDEGADIDDKRKEDRECDHRHDEEDQGLAIFGSQPTQHVPHHWSITVASFETVLSPARGMNGIGIVASGFSALAVTVISSPGSHAVGVESPGAWQAQLGVSVSANCVASSFAAARALPVSLPAAEHGISPLKRATEAARAPTWAISESRVM